MNPQPSQKQYQFRPPLITGVFIAFWVAATWYLLDLGRLGHPWATAAAFCTGGMGVGQIVHFFDDLSHLIAYRRRRKEYRNAATDYGESSFGDVDDARSAGLINKGGQ